MIATVAELMDGNSRRSSPIREYDVVSPAEVMPLRELLLSRIYRRLRQQRQGRALLAPSRLTRVRRLLLRRIRARLCAPHSTWI